MKKNFDEIFVEVGNKYGAEEWYEVFDSEIMDEVIEEIAKEYEVKCKEGQDLFTTMRKKVKGFAKWYDEMAEDL